MVQTKISKANLSTVLLGKFRDFQTAIDVHMGNSHNFGEKVIIHDAKTKK